MCNLMLMHLLLDDTLLIVREVVHCEGQQGEHLQCSILGLPSSSPSYDLMKLMCSLACYPPSAALMIPLLRPARGGIQDRN